MRIVVQRVREARVEIAGETVGRIGQGLLLLVGIAESDTMAEVELLAKKVAQLRIFSDEAGKMNRSVQDVEGGVLSVSQFTLYGDCRKGNRPSFVNAARPETAEPLYNALNQLLRAQYGLPVETGRFGADMQVSLLNDGPVTILMDTAS